MEKHLFYNYELKNKIIYLLLESLSYEFVEYRFDKPDHNGIFLRFYWKAYQMFSVMFVKHVRFTCACQRGLDELSGITVKNVGSTRQSECNNPWLQDARANIDNNIMSSVLLSAAKITHFRMNVCWFVVSSAKTL